MIRLYNTLTHKVENLTLQNSPTVNIYTCGPTVYDYMHIGNWFTFIRYDLLIRTLKASALEPNWVMNITDVGHLTSDADSGEDKLAKKAGSEGKNAWDIAKFYSDYFIKSLDKLNFIKPNQIPKATDHINEQIDFISKLEQKGYTYRIWDGIYFDSSKFSRYADFARLDLDEQQAGARVELNPEKHNPTDFALWKFSPTDKHRDMEWDSPWGRGFPGWHIECSAMSLKYLGETLDIHCGGIDHIPVHHTNEIAQSEALTEKPLATMWIHANHILISDEKISKSLGNTVTLEDIEQKGYTPEVLRLLVLESHYRSQSKFSWESLEAAKTRLLRYKNFAVRRYQTEGDITLNPPELLNKLQDDLNTPEALAELETFLEKADNLKLSKVSIESSLSLIDDLFGLRLLDTPDINDALKQSISDREQARFTKDFARADAIRSELEKNNLTVLDTPTGSIWQYLS